MPEPGVMAVTGPHASEGTVTLLTATEDKPANLGAGGSPRRRVPPGLAALAAQFPGLRVEGMLCHDGKSLVAAGHAGDQPVVIKVLADGDPGWRHRQRHEIDVYQIFAEHPPPVRVPRLVHTDGHRIVVMERLAGAPLGSGRYPRVLTSSEVMAAITLVGRLHGWQPLPEGFRPVFAYHKRIARYHERARSENAALDQYQACRHLENYLVRLINHAEVETAADPHLVQHGRERQVLTPSLLKVWLRQALLTPRAHSGMITPSTDEGWDFARRVATFLRPPPPPAQIQLNARQRN